jgi:hypothetical protein
MGLRKAYAQILCLKPGLVRRKLHVVNVSVTERLRDVRLQRGNRIKRLLTFVVYVVSRPLWTVSDLTSHTKYNINIFLKYVLD